MEGEAFGQVRRTNTFFNDAGDEVRADEFFDPHERYIAPIDELPPSVREHMDGYKYLLGAAAQSWGQGLGEAQGMILNHATNDVLILVEAVGRGSGRTAARTARAVFEHLIHYLEVEASAASAAQYEAHRHVTADQMSRRRIGLRRLKGKAAKREKNLLNDLGRKASTPLANAVSTYGPAFRRGWTAGTSLHDLAMKHGLSDEYESYRILSGVMHGSAGSLLGTRREAKGMVTHRLGPDLRLAPVSFHEGLTWWRRMLDELPNPPRPPGWNIGLRTATDVLLSEYPEIHATCQRLDNRGWPVGGSLPSGVAVLAVYPGGKCRWFLHEIRSGALWPAELVGDEPAGFTETVSRLERDLPNSGGRPSTAAMLGVSVSVLPDRAPVPAAQLLRPADVFGPSELRWT